MNVSMILLIPVHEPPEECLQILITDDVHSLISRAQACSEGERFHYVQMNDQDCD